MVFKNARKGRIKERKKVRKEEASRKGVKVDGIE
jgi:hypothetical protein